MAASPPQTAQDMRDLIDAIISERHKAAEASWADWKVCVLAVGRAREVAATVPVEGSAEQYGIAVVAALEPLFSNYNDPDGEHYSGKSDIGSVIARIEDALSAHFGIAPRVLG